jgi:hypothetical protein
VRKRGDEFWAEFEFYLSDVFVGEWRCSSMGWMGRCPHCNTFACNTLACLLASDTIF